MKILRTDPDRFGIRARLLTLLLPCTLGLLVLDSWNDYRELRRLVQEAYDQPMLETLHVLRNSLAPGPDGAFRLAAPLTSQTLFDAASPQRKHLHVGLTPAAPAGAAAPERLLLGESDLPDPPAAGPAQAAVWYDAYYRDYPVRMVALRESLVDGRGRRQDLLIQVAESSGPRERAEAASIRQGWIRDARMVLVVILLVWLGVTWSLRPLERLRRSVLESEGRALAPLDTSDVPHEVAPLVEAVNQHVASYRGLLERQSQFLADASHQLRTPLAIMLTQAGVALREKEPERLRETLRAIVVQISRSRRLCEQLLSLAHASDAAAPDDAPARVDLNLIAREVVLQYLGLAHEKDQDLGWVDAQEVPVLARAAELHEALANLVHNAIVYTPPGGRITVMALVRDGLALAEVSDDGPGIAPARRAAVFERFHHAGTEHGSAAHGAGLGMAIARAYARRNGGDIELADAEAGTGLRASLRLPLAA